MVLAPENGFYYRFNSQGKSDSDWNLLISDVDVVSWKDQVNYIMQQYAQKTDGSFVE